MLRRRAELEHEGLDVGGVRGGIECGGAEGGEGARLAAGERAVEREQLERECLTFMEARGGGRWATERGRRLRERRADGPASQKRERAPPQVRGRRSRLPRVELSSG